MLTAANIRSLIPGSPTDVAQVWLPHFQNLLPRYQITTPLRVAHFLAQIGHESAGLTVLEENLNYSAVGLLNTWPKRFTPEKAQQLARKPVSIANYVYANRNGNGDEASGDGWKFRGLGPIQTTGKANVLKVSMEIFGDDRLLENPMLLKSPPVGVHAACIYWKDRGINVLADRGTSLDACKAVTKKINAGLLHINQRFQRFNTAYQILTS